MKIIENNPNQLILRSDPYGQIIFGLFFALIGFAITYFIGRSVDIRCERADAKQITCQLTDKLLGITPVGKRTINHIQSAEVSEHRGSKGSYTYQVMFITANGPVSLTGYSSSGYEPKANIAEKVNNFIQGGRQDVLEFQAAMDWWVLLFLFIFGGFGVGAILLAKTVQIEMRRSEGVMRIRKDGLFGSGEQELLLREIQDVVLQSHRGSKGSTTYRVAFITTSDEEIPLTVYYSSGVGGKQRTVEAIKNFLTPYRGPQDQDPFA
jgi:hypothetical protein